MDGQGYLFETYCYHFNAGNVSSLSAHARYQTTNNIGLCIPNLRFMNSKTFARLMLFLPLFMFIGWAGYFSVSGSFTNLASAIRTINGYWNSAAIYGMIPYVFLAVSLLVWSRKKTAEEIQETFSLAPLMLMFLAGAAYLLLALYMAARADGSLQDKDVGVFMFVALIAVPATLIGGYVVVGVSILIYKLFQKLRLIRD